MVFAVVVAVVVVTNKGKVQNIFTTRECTKSLRLNAI